MFMTGIGVSALHLLNLRGASEVDAAAGESQLTPQRGGLESS